MSTQSSAGIWSTLLRDSSKRTKVSDSMVIVLGDQGCGKSTLLSTLSGSQSSADTASGLPAVSYDYMEIEDSLLPSDSQPPKVHFWAYNTKAFRSHIEFIREFSPSDRSAFVICLDMSKPESCLASLHRWLAFLKSKVDEMQGKYGKQEIQERRVAALRYLSNPNKSNAENVNDVNSSVTPPKNFVPWMIFPVIVVGCKTDLVDESNYQSLHATKLLQGKIRSICQRIGASFVAFSTAKELNIQRLRRYLVHRLYPDLVSLEGKLEDGIHTLYVPSGFDNEDLINISTGLPQSQIRDICMSFDAYIASNPAFEADTANSQQSSSKQQVGIELESDWLNSLQQFVNQVSASLSSLEPEKPALMPSSTIPSASSTSSSSSSTSSIATSNTLESTLRALGATRRTSVTVTSAQSSSTTTTSSTPLPSSSSVSNLGIASLQQQSNVSSNMSTTIPSNTSGTSAGSNALEDKLAAIRPGGLSSQNRPSTASLLSTRSKPESSASSVDATLNAIIQEGSSKRQSIRGSMSQSDKEEVDEFFKSLLKKK